MDSPRNVQVVISSLQKKLQALQTRYMLFVNQCVDMIKDHRLSIDQKLRNLPQTSQGIHQSFLQESHKLQDNLLSIGYPKFVKAQELPDHLRQKSNQLTPKVYKLQKELLKVKSALKSQQEQNLALEYRYLQIKQNYSQALNRFKKELAQRNIQIKVCIPENEQEKPFLKVKRAVSTNFIQDTFRSKMGALLKKKEFYKKQAQNYSCVENVLKALAVKVEKLVKSLKEYAVKNIGQNDLKNFMKNIDKEFEQIQKLTTSRVTLDISENPFAQESLNQEIHQLKIKIEMIQKEKQEMILKIEKMTQQAAGYQEKYIQIASFENRRRLQHSIDKNRRFVVDKSSFIQIIPPYQSKKIIFQLTLQLTQQEKLIGQHLSVQKQLQERIQAIKQKYKQLKIKQNQQIKKNQQIKLQVQNYQLKINQLEKIKQRSQKEFLKLKENQKIIQGKLKQKNQENQTLKHQITQVMTTIPQLQEAMDKLQAQNEQLMESYKQLAPKFHITHMKIQSTSPIFIQPQQNFQLQRDLLSEQYSKLQKHLLQKQIEYLQQKQSKQSQIQNLSQLLGITRNDLSIQNSVRKNLQNNQTFLKGQLANLLKQKQLLETENIIFVNKISEENSFLSKKLIQMQNKLKIIQFEKQQAIIQYNLHASYTASTQDSQQLKTKKSLLKSQYKMIIKFMQEQQNNLLKICDFQQKKLQKSIKKLKKIQLALQNSQKQNQELVQALKRITLAHTQAVQALEILEHSKNQQDEEFQILLQENQRLKQSDSILRNKIDHYTNLQNTVQNFLKQKQALVQEKAKLQSMQNSIITQLKQQLQVKNKKLIKFQEKNTYWKNLYQDTQMKLDQCKIQNKALISQYQKVIQQGHLPPDITQDAVIVKSFTYNQTEWVLISTYVDCFWIKRSQIIDQDLPEIADQQLYNLKQQFEAKTQKLQKETFLLRKQIKSITKLLNEIQTHLQQGSSVQTLKELLTKKSPRDSLTSLDDCISNLKCPESNFLYINQESFRPMLLTPRQQSLFDASSFSSNNQSESLHKQISSLKEQLEQFKTDVDTRTQVIKSQGETLERLGFQIEEYEAEKQIFNHVRMLLTKFNQAAQRFRNSESENLLSMINSMLNLNK